MTELKDNVLVAEHASESSTIKIEQPKKPLKVRLKSDLKRNGVLYLIFLPVLALTFVFCYMPLFGILMAFEDFSFSKGFFGSEWVWFENFIDLFSSPDFGNVMRNTVCIALINLTLGFLIPIAFALMLASAKPKWFKRLVQSVSYMPNFVATVVLVSLLTEFLDVEGILTQVLVALGFPEQNYVTLNSPGFWFVNLFADMWQGMGYASIVFVAAISSVNPNLHEAAALDGASRFQRLIHITIPCILPTVITMFTLKVGMVFKQGFDKTILMVVPQNYEYGDNLISYTYGYAIDGSRGRINYGLSSASSLIQSVISTVLLVLSNWLNKKMVNTSLF